MTDVTYEQMYEWLEKHELENPSVVREIMREIGYWSNDEIIYDDSDTKSDDFYKPQPQ